MDRDCDLAASEAPPSRHFPLPALSEELLHRTKPGGMVWSESRRFPRFEANAASFLRADETFAALGHESGTQDVWLRDLSRGGVRFIHASQLFPGEKVTLELSSGAKLRLEVMWCRRIAQGTFVSGCNFAAENSLADGDSSTVGVAKAT